MVDVAIAVVTITFRVQMMPISGMSVQITAVPEPTASSAGYRYVGLWRDIDPLSPCM